MPKRISKSLIRNTKTGQFVEGRATQKQGATATKNAVRGVTRPRSERIAATHDPLTPRNYRSVPATQAKNRFGDILQTVRDSSGPVFIERHGQAQAVVLGIDAYNKLASNKRTDQEQKLDYWTREFDALHARMQTQKARRAVDALFDVTDTGLNRRDS